MRPMSKILQTLAVVLMTSFLMIFGSEASEPVKTETVTVVLKPNAIKSIDTKQLYRIVQEPEKKEYDEDVKLIALVTMGEAEGECEEGKRLVIDTILNRVDSEHFPNTVYDVVYQKNQFSCMWDGRIEKCEVRDDICELVVEEMESRTNSDVTYFRTKHYSQYGKPLFPVGNHYFSSYE